MAKRGMGRRIWPWVALAGLVGSVDVAQAAQPLFLVYPPENHVTTADRIFLIGTAAPGGEVLVNGVPIPRSAAGHFAPSFPLQVGENRFELRYGDQTLTRTITRQSLAPAIPTTLQFGEDSLWPAVDVARQPGEWLCFRAIAPRNATVAVTLRDQTIPLQPETRQTTLPPNYAVLTQSNAPQSFQPTGLYQGCWRPDQPGDLGQPTYRLTWQGQTLDQTAPGRIQVWSPNRLMVATVTVPAGVARTGPSTSYSRLTPLPQGTQALITGAEGDWVRLDYGAWIRRSEVQIAPAAVPPRTLIRSLLGQQKAGWTEIRWPLQVPVPVTVEQGDRTFTLTLYNTTAQTDTIWLDDDPLVARLDWSQPDRDRVQYRFQLKSAQQWGYKLHYEGTTLVLALRHPPQLPPRTAPQPLRGITILLDPGHGGPEDLGARGPTGYPEKDVTLTIAQQLRTALEQRGAKVILTRETDVDLGLRERMDQIAQTAPTIALSLHYNALPDNGDAINTQGISTFWYHPQAHSLAVFLHHYLTADSLQRPSYGVYWNNLALTRPAIAPTVLLELGFMINPTEFEWIMDAQAQARLADAIATGLVTWFHQVTPPPTP